MRPFVSGKHDSEHSSWSCPSIIELGNLDKGKEADTAHSLRWACLAWPWIYLVNWIDQLAESTLIVGKKKPTSPLSQVRRVKKRDGLCYPSVFVICLWPLSLSDNPSGICLVLGLSCPFFSAWLCPALHFLRLCSSGLWFLSVCLSSVTSSWDLGMFVSTILCWEHP